MIFIEFRLCLPSVSLRHEFGHEYFDKMIRIDMGFCTIFITKNSSRLTKNLEHFLHGVGAEQLPQYRTQIKAIKSKARVQAAKDKEQCIERLIADNQRLVTQYSELNRKLSSYKNLAYAVRNIKEVDIEELTK
ncbi:hypothetical protein [Acinetobacter baumannii]|uniref:hypothetical protein n=1 Tax=Acinetobacter baumannii TaxID=470 RepID=UPI001D176B4E|nr:hypothetical protein [Acinetobacter baumannii]MDP7841245.1 hypothetical protein [Acinetobacter baumannii]MDP7862559.1 hypothetical protein [Acinetobacter baumannii]